MALPKYMVPSAPSFSHLAYKVFTFNLNIFMKSKYKQSTCMTSKYLSQFHNLCQFVLLYGYGIQWLIFNLPPVGWCWTFWNILQAKCTQNVYKYIFASANLHSKMQVLRSGIQVLCLGVRLTFYFREQKIIVFI